MLGGRRRLQSSPNRTAQSVQNTRCTLPNFVHQKIPQTERNEQEAARGGSGGRGRFKKQEGNGPIERASETKSALRFEVCDLNHLYIHVHIVYSGPYGHLRGHYSLQTALEVKSDLRFKISDLNYLHIHVHLAYIHKIH